MSTEYLPDREMPFSDLPRVVVIRVDDQDVETAVDVRPDQDRPYVLWVSVNNRPDTSLAVFLSEEGNLIEQVVRYGARKPGPVLQVLANHFGLTFECYLGLERVIPGGQGIVIIADLTCLT